MSDKLKILRLSCNDNIGQKLREVREAKKLTVTELGVPHSSVTTIELSQFPDCKLSTILKHAKGLRLSQIIFNLK